MWCLAFGIVDTARPGAGSSGSATAVEVCDYDVAWPARFEKVAAAVWPAVQHLALRIEHVGSTSVQGLAAKPVIDVDIVAASLDRVEEFTRCLSSIGYEWQGDLGVPGREAFEAASDLGLPRHHLYLVADGSRPYFDHTLLRDLLREDREARERYGRLKRDLASSSPSVESYTARKASFIAQLLERARRDRGLAPVDYWAPTPEELGR